MSVLSLGEMRKGVARVGDGHRRERILAFLDGKYRTWFGERVLPVDAAIAEAWGVLEVESPRTLPTIDALLAATSIAHGLVLVTHNKRDFTFPGLRVFDPWEQEGEDGPTGMGVNEPAAVYRVARGKARRSQKHRVSREN